MLHPVNCRGTGFREEESVLFSEAFLSAITGFLLRPVFIVSAVVEQFLGRGLGGVFLDYCFDLLEVLWCVTGDIHIPVSCKACIPKDSDITQL